MYEVRPDLLAVGKALGEETRFAIFSKIASSSTPLTVKDLVAAFSMHHSAIRIHLNKLEDAGLIVAEKRHRHGAVGRPELAFLPSPRATSISLPPRNYELLARLAMDYASARETDPDSSMEAFGLSWGRSYVAEQDVLTDGLLPLAEAMATLCDMLKALGSEPRLESVDGDGSFDLHEHNCLFGELSRDYDPTVCDLHQAVMRGMLTGLHGEGFTWERVSTLARGDHTCRVRVSPLEA